MLYYKRHIGDYIRDTAHLSLLEHGVYGRLMDVYYVREAPLPDTEAARLIGARSKDELAAMRTVLKEFWKLGEGGWTQDRCDHEIAVSHQKAGANRENGKMGGRPKRNGLHIEPKNNPDGFGNGTQDEPAFNHLATQTEPYPTIPLSNDPTTSELSPPPRTPKTPYETPEFHSQVIAAYHEILPGLPSVKVWSKKRAQMLNARIAERCHDGKPANTLEYWREFFLTVQSSPHLTGNNDRGWTADLEWLLTEGSFAKVIEGRYAARRQTGVAHAP